MTGSTESGPPAARGRAPWRRDFNLLWSASAATQFGSVNALLAAPLLALSLTGSPVFAGWVTAAATLPRILLSLPVGVLVDYLDRRRVMIVSLATRAALAALLTVGVFAMGGVTVLLPLVVAAQGVCLVFFTTAQTTVVPRIVPREELPGAMGRNEVRVHVAALLGRPLGGFLFDLHRSLSFAVDALVSALSVTALLRMGKDWVQPHTARPALQAATLLRELRAGFAFLRRDRFLIRVLLVCALANFFFQTLGLVLVLLAHQQHLPSLVIGCLIAATGCGGVLGSVTASRLQRTSSARRVIVVCVWSWLAMTLALAVLDHGGLLYVAVVLPLAWGGIGFTGAHINVALAVYQADEVPKELQGRVTGASRFFSGGAVPLGALASGYLIARLGTEDAVSLIAVVIGALAVMVSFMMRPAGRRLPQPPARWRAVRWRAVRWWAVARAGRSGRSARAGSAAASPPRPRAARADLLQIGRN
ncbi:MFS transporter [Actinomadura sp. ATCC 31491]|uniref:MFS transporter n=1 Tax=Actinomadura luzonensis TaxID=2805427 RepID=A0ABT0G172_9ACTN|nr:MFS transporter [Actinomadura luzonensis]MCK2217846.1 MFS transporter [Actinomadura luzonensis]